MVRALDHDEKVRELFIDNRDDGARYAITDTAGIMHINGVPWHLIITG